MLLNDVIGQGVIVLEPRSSSSGPGVRPLSCYGLSRMPADINDSLIILIKMAMVMIFNVFHMCMLMRMLVLQNRKSGGLSGPENDGLDSRPRCRQAWSTNSWIWRSRTHRPFSQDDLSQDKDTNADQPTNHLCLLRARFELSRYSQDFWLLSKPVFSEEAQ